MFGGKICTCQCSNSHVWWVRWSRWCYDLWTCQAERSHRRDALELALQVVQERGRYGWTTTMGWLINSLVVFNVCLRGGLIICLFFWKNLKSWDGTLLSLYFERDRSRTNQWWCSRCTQVLIFMVYWLIVSSNQRQPGTELMLFRSHVFWPATNRMDHPARSSWGGHVYLLF